MAPIKTHFNIEKYFDPSDNEVNVRCKICSRTLKKNRTFNLRKHLVDLHKINLEDKENDSTCVSLNKSLKQEVIKVKINKKRLIRSYIGLVTEDSIPFNVLNSENMRNIIDPICMGLKEKHGKNFTLNGNNCKNTLKHVAQNIRNAIQQEVKSRLLSLKIDSGTRLGRNIFGISAQFICKDEMKSRILGMAELKGAGASSSKNLAKEILVVLDKFHIKLSQIVSITSDNGANMIKTSKILKQNDIIDEDGPEAEHDNIEYTKKIDHFEKAEDVHVGEIQICRCAAHTAQLCAIDVSKNKDVKKYLLQCRNLCKYIRKPSNGHRASFEYEKLKLPQLDCPTRWGSTYEMIDRLKNAKHILSNIEAIENRTEDENFDANAAFWEFIDCYTTILNPLQKTIVKFQEDQLHYGNFYAVWLTCKLTTNQILSSNADNENSISSAIGNALIESIETRTKKLISNVGFDACLYLDPRFHQLLTDDQRKDAVNYLKSLWGKIQAHSPQHENSTNSFNVRAIDTTQGIEDNEFELLDNFLGAKIKPSDESMDVLTKIELLKLPHMKANLNVLRYWKERKCSDPELYALSTVCFAIPPTQVTIERAFSSLKLILADNRNRLNHETLENILLVKLNSTHLDKAIDDSALFEDEDTTN